MDWMRLAVTTDGDGALPLFATHGASRHMLREIAWGADEATTLWSYSDCHVDDRSKAS